jgi:hypothetical protein
MTARYQSLAEVVDLALGSPADVRPEVRVGEEDLDADRPARLRGTRGPMQRSATRTFLITLST